MSEVKYHNALDAGGDVIDISSVTEADRNKEYRCLGCGELMRPRLGERNAHHFAHKNDAFGCSPETYIHRLAKRKIKEWFDSDRPFNISYCQDAVCADAESCPFHNDEQCHGSQLKTYDLREYYDTCSIEKPIDGFVADLLLTSRKNPARPPILIEIQVTHKSENEKLESGHRIIEIKMNSEADIESLLESGVFEEKDGSSVVTDMERYPNVEFSGFRQETTPVPLEVRRISKFYLYKSGKAISIKEDCRSCREVGNSLSIFEIAIDDTKLNGISPYEIGFAMAGQSGFDIKTCQFCKYWRSGYEFGVSANFCCLYKKCRTPRNPKSREAQDCLCYCRNRERISKILDAVCGTAHLVVKQ